MNAHSSPLSTDFQDDASLGAFLDAMEAHADKALFSSMATGIRRRPAKSPVRINDEEWTPEQCSAEVIRRLEAQANTESGVSLHRSRRF